MHTLNRFLVLTALLVLIVPLSLGAHLLGQTLTREEVQGRFDEAIHDVRDSHSETISLSARDLNNQRIIRETERKLKDLEKRKRELRSEIATLLQAHSSMRDRSESLLATEERAANHLIEERERVAEFLRGMYTRAIVADAGADPSRLFLRRISGESLGDTVDESIREDALAKARQQLMVSLVQARDSSRMAAGKVATAASDVSAQIQGLLKEREGVLAEYRKQLRMHDAAERDLKLTEEQLEDVRREVALVEGEIARMQGEMARIEGRLRSRAERELLQMGLLDERPERYREDQTQFLWPVKGAISAGFYDARYRQIFSVPHKGIDIAVGQGTEVLSAKDGVVFLARDGGSRGYSYILIGHRDGYATLYGHLSQFNVSTGQDVHKGQIIGLSGGKPGSHGAGPMTTGAHLHFEILKNGVHVDPKSVLP